MSPACRRLVMQRPTACTEMTCATSNVLAVGAATMTSPPLNACTSTSCWAPRIRELRACSGFQLLIAVSGGCLQPQLTALAHLAAAFAEWQEDCAQAAHSHQEALAGLGLMPRESFQEMLQPVQVALLLECRLRVCLQQPVDKVGLPELLLCCEVVAGLLQQHKTCLLLVSCHQAAVIFISSRHAGQAAPAFEPGGASVCFWCIVERVLCCCQACESASPHL